MKHCILKNWSAIIALTIFSCASAWADGLVIRGGTCSADAFKSGTGVDVIPPNSDNIFNLSVNCTKATNKKVDYKNYTKGIPGTKFCVSTIAELERIGAKIQPDPVKDNNLHCLVNGDAKKIAGKLTRFP